MGGWKLRALFRSKFETLETVETLEILQPLTNLIYISRVSRVSKVLVSRVVTPDSVQLQKP